MFFAYLFSDVPAERFVAFWDLVQRALTPTGRFFFIDTGDNVRAWEKPVPGSGESGVVERRSADGRTFRIVKMFHDPAGLQRRLETLGWEARVVPSGDYRLFGYGSRNRSRTG